MYEITFKLISPICTYDPIPFDALLVHALYNSRKRPTDAKVPGIQSDRSLKLHLPLKKSNRKYGHRFYLASFGIIDGGKDGMEHWRKRWHEQNDFLVDFGKSKRRIDTASGDYRSYNMPIPTIQAEEIKFYFESENPEEVEKILFDLAGIGKNVNSGYGWFSDFTINQKETNKKLIFYRYLPSSYEMRKWMERNKINYTEKNGRYFPPYWDRSKSDLILVPK